jgi:UDP-N-acetylglucosamine 2-epimerase (non-hydrolysing)
MSGEKMEKAKIIIVAGARPNFMKIAPLMHILNESSSIEPILVHTGQHYDARMSHLFFEQLNIPRPHINLEVGSASHAVQTARIMERFEKVCIDEKPQMVMVVGDVNSTAACTLVAAKLHIKPAHYEAGLRSRDRTMPEEINRLVTDAVSELFFTTSRDADENLLAEGVSPENIFMVGNLMIDSLARNLPLTENIPLVFPLTGQDKEVDLSSVVESGHYAAMTFHRPSNVDEPQVLKKLVDIWSQAAKKIPLIFPIHPRTYKNLVQFGLIDKLLASPNIFLTEPVGYLEFIRLVKGAVFVLTDSGGIQEESTWLNITCLTIRPNTERPVTIWEGSNKLIKVDEISGEIELILKGEGKKGRRPKYWDGKTAERMRLILEDLL